MEEDFVLGVEWDRVETNHPDMRQEPALSVWVSSRCYICTCFTPVSVPETCVRETGGGGEVSLRLRHLFSEAGGGEGIGGLMSGPRRPLHPEHLWPRMTAEKTRHKPSLLQVIQSDDSSPDRHCHQLMDGCRTDGWKDGCSSSNRREENVRKHPKGDQQGLPF